MFEGKLPGDVEGLARSLLGEPNGRLSDRRGGDLRFGRRGSLSVKVEPHPKAGAWFDFESWVGGGIGSLEGYLRSGVVERPSRGDRFGGVERRERDDVRVDRVEELWARSVAVPYDGRHPARRWLGARALWRPEVEVPGALRWARVRDGPGGVLVALAAAPERWMGAWPFVPAPQGVQRIPVDGRGRGTGIKKSLGSLVGGVMVLGDPVPDKGKRVLVCEGVADGLSLAARVADPVVVVYGTSGMLGAGDSGVARYLAGFGCVEVWADSDGPGRGGKSGRLAPAGARAGYALGRAVEAAGGAAEVVTAARGCKDAADYGALVGLGWMDATAFVDGLEKLRAGSPGVPEWELGRRASLAAVRY